METINFGFIGTGNITKSSAARLLTHPRGRVVACQDLSEERRTEFSEAFKAKPYAEASELLADASVDAVYIAVPNKFHAPLTIEALRAGKHVLLEKPFAMNASEAESVLEVARETGNTFMLGMNQRYFAEAQKVKHMADSGELGEIYHGKAYWVRRSGIPRLGTWFGNRELAGAGCINDVGVHMLDLCLHLMGNFKPVSVMGKTYTKFGNRGLGEGSWGKSDREDIIFDVDDFATAHIQLENGATIAMETAWASHRPTLDTHNVELFGTDAGASVFPLELYRSDLESGEYQVVHNLDRPVALPHADRFHNFINHLLDDEPLLVKTEEALAVQKILDAVSESSRTGQAVHF